MRRLTTSMLTALAAATFCGSAHATLIAYEGFDYAAGAVAIGAGNGGTGWTGAWSKQITAAGTTLSQGSVTGVGGKLAGAPGNYDASRPFGSINSGELWFSYLYTSASGSATKFIFFDNGFNRPIQLVVDPWESLPHTAGNLDPANIGARGQQYFVVGRIDFDAGTTVNNEAVRLWISADPTSPSATQPLDGAATYTDLDVTNANTLIRVEIAISDSASAIDEIRLGTTYADVVPVPEPAVAAMLGACGLYLRRRRA